MSSGSFVCLCAVFSAPVFSFKGFMLEIYLQDVISSYVRNAIDEHILP